MKFVAMRKRVSAPQSVSTTAGKTKTLGSHEVAKPNKGTNNCTTIQYAGIGEQAA